MTQSLYVDSSAILAILFEESRGSDYAILLQKHKKRIFSSALLEAEIYAAAKRENVPLEKAAGFIALVGLVFPDESLQKEYLKILEQGYLRGADAYHVATALYLDPQTQNLIFVTADRNQSKIAQSLGFEVA